MMLFGTMWSGLP